MNERSVNCRTAYRLVNQRKKIQNPLATFLFLEHIDSDKIHQQCHFLANDMVAQRRNLAVQFRD